MALVAAALGTALAAHAQKKRAASQISAIEDGPQMLPEAHPDKELYDPLRRGPRWATNWLANRALHFRKRWPQPYNRPLHDNGQHVILARNVVGPETAQLMQHRYAEALPEGPVFFTRKTTAFDRQIQPFRIPAYHPGLTHVDNDVHDFNRHPMPYVYPAGHALA